MAKDELEPKFLVGDMVEWRSQAGGNTRTKRGEVVAVIRPGQSPRDAVNTLLRAGGVRSKYGGGIARRGTSYLVVVPPKSSRALGTLYWPLADKLSPLSRAERAAGGS